MFQQTRHRVWLDEEVTGRNEVTTTFFYVWPLWCACPFSGCEWAYCHGTLLCEFPIPKSGESWEEMTNIEPRNKMLYSPGSVQWPGRPVILVADKRKKNQTRSEWAPERLTCFDKGQITHLICARLKHDLYDFCRGCFWAFFYKKKNRKQAQNTP